MMLKKTLSFLTTFVFVFYFSQHKICKTDILNGIEIRSKNEIHHFLKYNFSTLWLAQNNRPIYGIIGKEHQRFRIKLLSIVKNPKNPNEYWVHGKTMVKNNICDFMGKITLTEIHQFKTLNFGVDDEYKDKKIKNQGIIIAKYTFFEEKSQSHSGYFSGILKTKFYINKNNLPRYNDINIHSDGYFNNSFVGKWKSYQTNLEKICHWGDYRVPFSNCDFDIGIGEFNVSKKYHKKGWIDIALSGQIGSLDITPALPPSKSEKSKPWWK